ncbi:recombinase family protein [Enterovibrio paralichthyis]|uniref:recombinase family protein n=1 Tax=Enterovibrio paralichthyis TaxID=2853805 RepID=UPI001C497697|nr:recombinase family protein [Enterovibrio paralichthyis]MBV7300248.1 recombinase family protein [Enterovibrio paralichthyis]
MFIRAYLRASTIDQDAERGREVLDRFIDNYGHRIASYYIENISGTKLERPELKRLLRDSHPGDVLLVEQIDRLTRLSDDDWKLLRREIEERGVRIVSIDVQTSLIALNPNSFFQGDKIIETMLDTVNRMLIDLLAVFSRKDYETRRNYQRQGIERAKREGKYLGRKADAGRQQKVVYFRHEKNMSLSDIAVATGYSRTHVCRILKAHKESCSTAT